MEKKVPQQGQQGDVGGREGGRQTIRSLDDREISVVVAWLFGKSDIFFHQLL